MMMVMIITNDIDYIYTYINNTTDLAGAGDMYMMYRIIFMV